MAKLWPLTAALLAAASPLCAQEEMRLTHEGLQGDLVGTREGELRPDQPTILIIPGSGPIDRDGNSPLGIKASTYRLLAEGLAEQGIGSVRIDKRGMFGSDSAIPDANAVTVADYVSDVAAWREFLRRSGAGECVWLLGHSEGALIAMAAAAANPEGYCGLLLVAAPGRNLGEVIRAQIAASPGAGFLLPQVDDIVARLTARQSVPAEEIHPGLLPLFGPQVQGFVASLFQQDPPALLKAHDLPVLILNGRKDIQTPDSDAELLATAREDAKLVLLEDVNHVLKRVAGEDRAANLATYGDPDLPLAPGVIEAITEFVGEATDQSGA